MWVEQLPPIVILQREVDEHQRLLPGAREVVVLHLDLHVVPHVTG